MKVRKRAMAGLTLTHLPAPPTAIPTKVDGQYFAVSREGPFWDHILQTKRVGIYVPGELPEAELDVFVDALARRIASFDRRAIAAAKNLVNDVSLPSADRLLAAITSFLTALTWPETQQPIGKVLQRGLQQDTDFETRWPEVLGTLLETS